ncbi:MAG: hypothetical protein AB1631_05315 [Acidobacteriota bacterium]
MMKRIFAAILLLPALVSTEAAQSRYSKSKPSAKPSSKPSAKPATPPAEPAERLLKNSWRGITPLQSSAQDVARLIGVESTESVSEGPFKVEGGEVTFSYLTPSLAKIYRAPAAMVGKVFSIYFKPSEIMSKDDLKLSKEFRRCTEDMDKTFYYFVSDAGLVYQLLRNSDRLESIIYQPSRAQVRRLAVNTGCVF